jgi:hypothetical protein
LAKLPDQSYDHDLPLMRLAAALTNLSVEENPNSSTNIRFGGLKEKFRTCQIDTSAISWTVSGPGEGNGRERRQKDIEAFQDLIRLSGLRLLSLRMPASIRDELVKGKFPNPVKSQINQLLDGGRVTLQADAFRATAGQRPYAVSQDAPEAESHGLDEELLELLASEADPSIPAEDREHITMAILSHRPFVTMDYRLVQRMAKAIEKQVELVEGEVRQKQIPKRRPPLLAPVVTPSVLLQQLLFNQPTWNRKLEMGKQEPDCALCEGLRRKLAYVGMELVELLKASATDPDQLAAREKDFETISAELVANSCCDKFFEDIPEEYRPDYWKTFK